MPENEPALRGLAARQQGWRQSDIFNERQRGRRVVQKAVRPGLAHVPVDVLGADVAARSSVRLEDEDLGVGRLLA
jgi:hypothetical protein